MSYFIISVLKKSRNVQELIAYFKKNDIKYLVANIVATVKAFTAILGQKEKILWNEFLNGCLKEVFSDSVNSMRKICSKQS